MLYSLWKLLLSLEWNATDIQFLCKAPMCILLLQYHILPEGVRTRPIISALIILLLIILIVRERETRKINLRISNNGEKMKATNSDVLSNDDFRFLTLSSDYFLRILIFIFFSLSHFEFIIESLSYFILFFRILTLITEFSVWKIYCVIIQRKWSKLQYILFKWAHKLFGLLPLSKMDQGLVPTWVPGFLSHFRAHANYFIYSRLCVGLDLRVYGCLSRCDSIMSLSMM